MREEIGLKASDHGKRSVGFRHSINDRDTLLRYCFVMRFQVRTFATIRIFVDDVQKSRDWYKSFFGIEPVEDLENFVSFKIAQTCLDISVVDEKSPRSCGGSVGYWLVDDIENAISTAIELGGRVYRGPLRVDEVQRTIAQIVDPYGNVIGLESEF